MSNIENIQGRFTNNNTGEIFPNITFQHAIEILDDDGADLDSLHINTTGFVHELRANKGQFSGTFIENQNPDDYDPDLDFSF